MFFDAHGYHEPRSFPVFSLSSSGGEGRGEGEGSLELRVGTPKTHGSWKIGVWSLEFLWSLVVGAWIFLMTPPSPRSVSGFSLTRLQRAIRLGIRSLWLHRLRSLLTVLGIVFGVCSVIAMLAIGEGASFEAQEQIKNLGSQNIILRSVKPPEEQKVSEKANQSYVLQYGITYTDVKCIRSTIPGVTVVVPGRIMREYVWNVSRRLDCEIMATVPWYPQMRNHHVAQGRFFDDKEMDDKANVCVLGAEMVQALFPLDSPLGKDVRVGGDYYRVVGVMERSGKGAKTDETQENVKAAADRMFIPLETAKTRYGEILRKIRSGSFEAERIQLHEVTVRVETPEQVRPVADAIKEVMGRNHK